MEAILSSVRPMTLGKQSTLIVEDILNLAYDYTQKNNAEWGLILAATFDLLVSSEYYQSMTHRGWTYCSEEPTLLLYPFTNTCPRCLSKGKFVFANGNKPESGRIGTITLEILCAILQHAFKKKGNSAIVYKASEPVDVIIHDPISDSILLAEVKAAPLLTLPISVSCDRQTEMVGGNTVSAGHSLSDNPFFKESELSIFFPQTEKHKERTYGVHVDWTGADPFLHAICDVIRDNGSFFGHYYGYWCEAFDAYGKRARDVPSFWLTNGCGQPVPRPDTWPSRRGSGYESVSDGKTSVGMDRTDDIKKGTYQVLKLGSEFKPSSKRQVRTALISNVHAVRHYGEYLLPIHNVVWAVCESTEVQTAGDLDSETAVYNLFDGIISFTKCDIRDKWLSALFDFGRE